jgi:hypothetical protein
MPPKKRAKKKPASKYDTKFDFDISLKHLFKLTFKEADEKIAQSKKSSRKKP